MLDEVVGSVSLNIISGGIGVGASAAALIAAFWTVVQLSRRRWNETVGRRRVQASIFDRLACGSALAYIDELLGTPQFLGEQDGRQQRIYPMDGAWVMVELDEDVVISYSITITDKKMYYPIGTLTFGNLGLELGKDSFEKADPHFSGDSLWIGARRYGYLRYYYFGNPGGYQHYWLSFNMCGAGHPLEYPTFSSGEYGESGPGERDASSIVANTLTVLGPAVHGDVARQFMARDVLGPDHDLVRLSFGTRRPR